MRHDNEAAGGSVFPLAFFTGMAIGAAIGVLFAPSEGQRLRTQIRDGAGRVRRNAMGRYQDAAHAVGDIVERGRSATAAGRDAFRQARANGPAPDA